MVDYSKWDKLSAELSSDEEETARGPRVTTFKGEKGTSIVIGPSGASVVDKSAGPSTLSSAGAKSGSEIHTEFQLESRNGGVTDTFTWCQDRYEVCIRKELQPHIKGSDIEIRYDHIESRLCVSNKSSKETLIAGTTRYKFDVNDDDICPVSWEIVTIPDSKKDTPAHRVLEITLRKVSPIPGAVIWWKHVFVDDPEIDVTKIAERVKSAASTEAANAWEEAHKMFRERIATREPVEIDIGDGGDGDGADDEDDGGVGRAIA